MKTMKTAPSARPERAKDACVIQDTIAGVETAILQNIRCGPAAPHQRILPHCEWARRLGTSRYRVEKAIAKLAQKGFVYRRHGSGVYLTEKALGQDAGAKSAMVSGASTKTESIDVSAFLRMPHVPLFKTLRVHVAGGLQADEIQLRMWQRAFAAFHQEYPFVDLEPDFASEKTGSHDVLIAPPHMT